MKTADNVSVYGFFKPHLRVLIPAFLLVAVGIIAELFIPMVTQKAIDSGIARADVRLTVICGLGIIALALTRAGFQNFANILFTGASSKVTKELRSALMKHVFSLEFSRIDKLQTGRLMTRVYSDTSQIRRLSSFGFRMMFQGILLVVGSNIMIFRIDIKIGFLVLLLTLINASLFAFFAVSARKLFLKVQNQLGKMNSTIQQNFAGISVVKIFSAEEKEIENFGAEADKLKNLSVKVGKLMATAFPLFMLVINLGILIILQVGGKEVLSNRLAIGNLVALTNYLFMIMFPLMMLGMSMTIFAQASASSQRIKEILSIPRDERETYSEALIKRGKVKIRGLSFSHTEGASLLSGLDLDIREGETLGIIGLTGCGKTTLLNLIAGFYFPQEGGIEIDGVETSRIPVSELRNKIAVVFQNPVLFRMSVKDNILFDADRISDDELDEISDISELNDFVNASSGGMELEIMPRGINISGGQRQRIAIARALVSNKPVLLLDDSFSSLDRITESRLLDKLLRYRAGMTTVIVSQKISSIKKADRIAFLHGGKIINAGKHSEMLEECKLYREVYTSQGYET
ncbi:ABC transporter ATP-binding protein [candidate division WOR-3 bacterium]|nr:ABC transporter ATP-binding protein [candidate division WOR-3 bacterium]